MQFHRVAHVAPDWQRDSPTPSDNGHPLYVHRIGQRSGRFDQPRNYLGLYMARQPQAAIGEALQGFSRWTADVVNMTRDIDGLVLERALVTINARCQFIDLDNGATLDKLGWRPSDVVNKDRGKTQELALAQWNHRSSHRMGGLMWWSSIRPAWTVAMAWDEPQSPTFAELDIVDVTPLHLDHPDLITAAELMARELG